MTYKKNTEGQKDNPDFLKALVKTPCKNILTGNGYQGFGLDYSPKAARETSKKLDKEIQTWKLTK